MPSMSKNSENLTSFIPEPNQVTFQIKKESGELASESPSFYKPEEEEKHDIVFSFVSDNSSDDGLDYGNGFKS